VQQEIEISLDGLVEQPGASGQAAVPPCREAEAEYTLEYPVCCPYCGSDLEVVRVVRMLRTKVNFTSMLPRRGRVISCPKCFKILAAELSLA